MNKKKRLDAGTRLHEMLEGNEPHDPMFMLWCADRLTELEAGHVDKWPGRWVRFCMNSILSLAFVLFCFIFFDVTRSLFF